MGAFILGPREHHGVATASEYEQRQSAAIARLRKSGARFEVHEVLTPLVAFVSANSWVVNCECGSGNAVDPAWGVACCFGCGAIHRTILFPPNHQAIAAALLAREVAPQRHWLPGETVAQLDEQTRRMRRPAPERAR